jgi:hypothetical protein
MGIWIKGTFNKKTSSEVFFDVLIAVAGCFGCVDHPAGSTGPVLPVSVLPAGL